MEAVARGLESMADVTAVETSVEAPQAIGIVNARQVRTDLVECLGRISPSGRRLERELRVSNFPLGFGSAFGGLLLPAVYTRMCLSVAILAFEDFPISHASLRAVPSPKTRLSHPARATSSRVAHRDAGLLIEHGKPGTKKSGASEYSTLSTLTERGSIHKLSHSSHIMTMVEPSLHILKPITPVPQIGQTLWM